MEVIVIKKILFELCALALIVGTLSVTAQAQSGGCAGWWTSGWNYMLNPPPNGAFGCGVTGPWLVTCQMMYINCAPTPECSDCKNPKGSLPINLVTGNTDIKQTDVNIAGLGGGLTLVRTWNSMWPSTETAFQVGLFGPNWRSTYEERVFVGSDNYIKYARSDGGFWSFGFSAGTYVPVAPANATATLVQGSNYWTLTFQNGEQRRFNYTSGSLTAIIDRNGNTTQLAYDGLNRLYTVTDPASRTLTFTYQSPSSYLITGVSSSVGISLTYAYDAQNRLSQVTNPDLTTLTFAYDSQSRITSVTDSNGKILESHTYDNSGRGRTGSQAGGVNAVTVTYY